MGKRANDGMIESENVRIPKISILVILRVGVVTHSLIQNSLISHSARRTPATDFWK